MWARLWNRFWDWIDPPDVASTDEAYLRQWHADLVSTWGELAPTLEQLREELRLRTMCYKGPWSF